jgi:hypothetical protein
MRVGPALSALAHIEWFKRARKVFILKNTFMSWITQNIDITLSSCFHKNLPYRENMIHIVILSVRLRKGWPALSYADQDEIILCHSSLPGLFLLSFQVYLAP